MERKRKRGREKEEGKKEKEKERESERKKRWWSFTFYTVLRSVQVPASPPFFPLC